MSQTIKSIISPQLWPIYFTVFLDLLGLGIVIPIFAPLFLDLTAGILPANFPLSGRTILLGLLIATFPLTQFFGAPILGGWSDRFGRKKVLILSLLGTTLGYVVFAFGILTNQLWLLFAGRIIDGFTGGNIATALSAVADVSQGQAKTKNFGLVGVAVGAGFILGPFFGGKLGDNSIISWFTLATPFWFAAILAAVNTLMILVFFRETLTRPILTKISLLTGIHNLYRAMQLPDLRSVFLVIFLLNFGFNFFAQFFQVFLVQRFNFSQVQIGDMFAYAGIWIVLTQGVLTRPLAHIFKHHQIVSWASIGLAISLPLLLVPEKSIALYWLLPLIALCQGLVQPNSTALISDLGHESTQGEILGINQSIQSLAQAIPPLIAGVIVVIHPSLPIWDASFSVFAAWLVFSFLFKPPTTPPSRLFTRTMIDQSS